jgi:translocation and assembly module TamB
VSETTPASTAPAPPPRSGRARWPWWVAGIVVGLPLLLAASTSLWLGSSSSLRHALVLAQRFLPEGQQLDFGGAEGSIARGGAIGWLEWRGDGVSLRIDDVALDWRLADLLRKELDVRRLRAGRVHLRLAPRREPPPPAVPFVMPEQLTLPVRLVVNLRVDRIEIETVDASGASSTQVLEDLSARYVYDDVNHVLTLGSLAYGQSRTQAEVRLGARNLALEARLAASLRDPVSGVPLAMLAHAGARGTLAGGEDARIDVELDARELVQASAPDPARLLEELASLRTTLEQGEPGTPQAAQLFARGSVHPWRSQPLQALQLRASRFNAAAFHASAPRTDVGAEVLVTPAQHPARSWELALSLRNAAPGAWDAGLAPVQAVEVRAQLTPEEVRIQSSHVELAGDPAGGVDLTGVLPLAGLAGAHVSLQLQQVDLNALITTLPQTRLAGAFDLAPLDEAASGQGWQAGGGITNALAGRLDQDRLPLTRFTGHIEASDQRWRARAAELAIADGLLRVEGSYAAGTRALELRGELRRLPLAAIHEDLASDGAARLSGTLGASGTLDGPLSFQADIGSDAGSPAGGEWEIRTVHLNGDWSPTRLRVREIDIDALGARLEGRGIDVALPALESIEAHLSGEAPGLALQADATMRGQSGGGTLSLTMASAPETLEWLRRLPLVGESIPAMDASGGATLVAQWQGGWQQWREGLSDPRRHPELAIDARLASEQLHLELPEGSAVGAIDADAFEARVQGNLAAASLLAAGRVRAGDSAAALDVSVQMQRDAADAPIPGWQLLFERMQVEASLPQQPGPWMLAVDDGLEVNISTGSELQLQGTAGRLSLTPPPELDAGRRPLVVSWEPLQFRRSTDGAMRLASRGTIDGIQLGWLDALPDRTGAGQLEGAGLGTNLVLAAEWNLALAETLEVHARVRREQGELWLLGNGGRAATAGGPPPDGVVAGIRAFEVRIDSAADELTVVAEWDSDRAGIIHVDAATRLERSADGWRLPREAALSGRVDARVDDLAMWALFAPPGWRVQGELAADLAIEGTVGTPLLRGSVDGNRLNLRSVLEGVELHGGRLHARLEGQRLSVEQLEFEGGTGSRAYIPGLSGNRTQAPRERGRMTARGVVDWSGIGGPGPGTGIAMDFQARLERMQVLVRNDRQLTLDGEMSAALQEGTLRVRGDLDVVRATILLPDAGAPTLGDDVIVVRNADELDLVEVAGPGNGTGRLESPRPMDVEIRLDLGRDLALQGYGITTRLEGELTLQSSARRDRPFSLFGEVRTDEGRYRAWGQSLNVETGEVAFNGDPENPSLNLLAIRPEIDVRAGVRVTGTLRAPQVELYSDPPLPEAEKLSWVVLGRPTAIGGEGSSVQRAALGLLAGRAVGSLADDLGVDELGLGESSVSVGKRISDQLYLTYEAGLSGAASTLYIFYDITRRFTIRGASGEANAVDLIYTFDFD